MRETERTESGRAIWSLAANFPPSRWQARSFPPPGLAKIGQFGQTASGQISDCQPRFLATPVPLRPIFLTSCLSACMTSPGPGFELQPHDSITVIRFRDARLLAADRITGIDRDVSAWLSAHPRAKVVLDLSEVEAVSSDFLAKLIGWRTLVQKHQGRLKLAGLGPSLQELFDVTRLSKKFEIEPDVETAATRLAES